MNALERRLLALKSEAAAFQGHAVLLYEPVVIRCDAPAAPGTRFSPPLQNPALCLFPGLIACKIRRGHDGFIFERRFYGFRCRPGIGN